MFTVTFVRHGESEDNLMGRHSWAGWKDAPLSEVGLTQAAALGRSFSSVPINVIYASPLKRAYSTALSIQQHRSTQVKLNVQPDLRAELWYGRGMRMAAIDAAMSSPNRDEALQKAILELAARDIFPAIPNRKHKFPEGESLDDLTVRAKRALKECVLTHFAEYVDSGSQEDVHVVAVSHGLCISEMVSALVRLDPQGDHGVSYKGLLNTVWTRAVISIRDNLTGLFDVSSPPPLEVKVTDFNKSDHLKALNTTATTELDDARKYFAGATTVSNQSLFGTG